MTDNGEKMEMILEGLNFKPMKRSVSQSDVLNCDLHSHKRVFHASTPKCNTFLTGNPYNLDLKIVKEKNLKSRNPKKLNDYFTMNDGDRTQTLQNLKNSKNGVFPDRIEIYSLKNKMHKLQKKLINSKAISHTKCIDNNELMNLFDS
mmetsp:Transcript_24185/g.21489  ORF Transcript_24185/g.21489 Transcript_24185/m.21489 type:complete len:147 (+) Transcript_24185:688-1128(+)